MEERRNTQRPKKKEKKSTMAKRKSTTGQTMIHKILHRKLKREQHEPHLIPGVTSDALCIFRTDVVFIGDVIMCLKLD
jgi:hypothetical protein